MNVLLLLLLPIAAASGWYVAQRNYRREVSKRRGIVPRDYLIGLNYLLNEQPDRAVDVFIKMLEVDADTVETHLALGGLFRRSGEVDRAIRIHQNLIARPHLDKQQKVQALLALGQDYMRAGVLDRAERIFLEVVDTDEEKVAGLRYLLDIYQQEKAWERAVGVARKLEATTGELAQANISHYYCELALSEQSLNNIDQARKYLKKALSIDKQCVRASLLYGSLEVGLRNYKSAIRFYKQVMYQDADFLSEAIIPIVECYRKLGKISTLISYLKECLQQYPRITLVLIVAEQIHIDEGIEAAIDFITAYLHKYPSIRGQKGLIELQMQKEGIQNVDNLHILNELTASMLENKPIYRCTQCGFYGKSLHWLCPRCKCWNTTKPIHGLEGD